MARPLMRPVQGAADRGLFQTDKAARHFCPRANPFAEVFKQQWRFRFDPHRARGDDHYFLCKGKPFHTAQHGIR